MAAWKVFLALVVLFMFSYSPLTYANENAQWFNGALDACFGEIDRRFVDIPLYELFENDHRSNFLGSQQFPRQFKRLCEKGLGYWVKDQQVVKDFDEWFEQKFEFAARAIKRPYVVVEKNENAINYYIIPKKGQESKESSFKVRFEFTPDFSLPALFDEKYEDIISPAGTLRLKYGTVEAHLKYNPIRERLRFKLVQNHYYFNLIRPELYYELKYNDDNIRDRVEGILNFKTGDPDLHLQLIGMIKPAHLSEWEINIRTFALIDWEYKVLDFLRGIFSKK